MSARPRDPRSPATRLAARVVHEPLLQFLLAGAALFVAYYALAPTPARPDASHRIELTRNDLRQMTVAWLAQGRPAPTAEQMQRLIAERVREEILFREALALGLDADDSIVKRRMVQKMEFLAEDLSDLREPTDAELGAWFERNRTRFTYPPRVTFRHLYFSPDRRGGETRPAVERARGALSGSAEGQDPAALADDFPFQDQYPERTPDQVAKDFGPHFARALVQLEPGAWRGPIESGFGWHLVWVESITPVRVPALEEVEAEVREAWVDEQRRTDRQRMYDAMRARYTVVVPDEAMWPTELAASSPMAPE